MPAYWICDEGSEDWRYVRDVFQETSPSTLRIYKQMSGTIYTTKADAYIGSQLKDLAFLEGLSFELVSDAEETRIEFADTVEVHRANVLDITLKMFQRIQAWGAENVNGFYKTGKNRGDRRSITSNQTNIV